MPERDAGHDAHPRAREAGQRGKRLRDANRSGAGQREGRQRLVGRTARAPLGQRDQRSGDQQKRGGAGRPAQVGFKRFVERRADDRQRHGGDEAQRNKPSGSQPVNPRRARRLLCAEPQAAQDRDDFAAKRPNNRQQRAGVNGDIKGQPRVVPAEQPARQSEMSAAADRQKFGDPLDDGEGDDFKDRHARRIRPQRYARSIWGIRWKSAR